MYVFSNIKKGAFIALSCFISYNRSWLLLQVAICELPFNPISSEVLGGIGGT